MNTLFWATPIHIFALTKLLIRSDSWQRQCAKAIMFFGSCWIVGMNTIMRTTQPTSYDIEGLEGLSKKQWYFINCNHQSWADILVLFITFHGSCPVPEIFHQEGALQGPCHGYCLVGSGLPLHGAILQGVSSKKNPHMKGKDLETTRKACERYRHTPVSILNFIEGTRFTKEKHDRQESPVPASSPAQGWRVRLCPGGHGREDLEHPGCHHHLLPRGLAPSGTICADASDWISVKVKEDCRYPQEFLSGDYQNDEVFRDRIQTWVSDLWQEKDNLMEQHKDEHPRR
ncbi:MAG: hypothetical protein MZU91_01785 [Desulfosudis oleivorans]|nr:hypothetical protein [Desulfosudis oleivorans]